MVNREVFFGLFSILKYETIISVACKLAINSLFCAILPVYFFINELEYWVNELDKHVSVNNKNRDFKIMKNLIQIHFCL